MFLELFAAAATVLAGGAVQDTDTTFAAGGADRLDVESAGGEVVVEAWDRDEIRVQAAHARRNRVEVRRRGMTVYVDAAAIVDYRIWVPERLDVSVEGWQTSIVVQGTRGRVEAETFTGSVDIRGGRDRVTATAVNGNLNIQGAQGEVTAEGMSGTIRISESAGDIRAEVMSGTIRISDARGSVAAETVGGSVVLEGIAAAAVDAAAVGGSIRFQGELQDDGEYYFATHAGRILLELPAAAAAELEVYTLSGSVRMDHAGAVEDADARDRSRRLGRDRSRSRYVIGDGGAVVEIESFSGSVVVRQANR